MSYASAVQRLYALGAELAPGTAGQPRRKFDLAHMRRLAAALGDPQRRFPSVLIAGTNGKGSTAAMLGSILSCAGYRTGLYTSPHLQRVNERIQISDRQPGTNSLTTITDTRFAALFEQVDQASRDLVAARELPHPPSFFEVLTAMAFLAFAEAAVDLAVLEVGLGGRLDATNIVDPLVSIITDISLDHTEWLGTTLQQIAREKAGILRPNGTMVILPQHPEVNAAIGEVAMQLGVTGINAATEMHGTMAQSPSARPDTAGPHWHGLAGSHQERNAALASSAAGYLAHNKGFRGINEAAIASGIGGVVWPGRLELTVLPSGQPLLFDVAHNPAGIWSLRSYLSQAFASGQMPAPHTLIFSAYADKAIQEMMQILFPLFDEPGDQILLVPMPGPRSASAESLQQMAGTTGATATLLDSVEAALSAANHVPGGSTVVTGSVHLIGQAKTALEAVPAGHTA